MLIILMIVIQCRENEVEEISERKLAILREEVKVLKLL